jgi:hypothetical protein
LALLSPWYGTRLRGGCAASPVAPAACHESAHRSTPPAGVDLAFPTRAKPPEIAAVRERVGCPIVAVDTPGCDFDDEEAAGISSVLCYGLSAGVQDAAVEEARGAAHRAVGRSRDRRRNSR